MRRGAAVALALALAAIAVALVIEWPRPGARLFARSLGTPTVTALAARPDGALALAGYYHDGAALALPQPIPSAHESGDFPALGVFLAGAASDGTLGAVRCVTPSGGRHSADWHRALDVAALADGGSLVTGTFHGVTTFGEGPSAQRRDAVSWEAGFLARFHRDGAVVWVRAVRGADERCMGGFGPTDVAALADGGALVVGELAYAAVLETGGAPRPLRIEGSTSCIARYSPSGDLVWLRRFGLAARPNNGWIAGAPRVAVFPDGGAAVVANFGSVFTIPSDPPVVLCPGDPDETRLPPFDPILARFAPDGRLLWARPDGSRFVAALPDGGIAVAGAVEDERTLARGTPAEVTVRGTGNLRSKHGGACADVLVASFASDGALRWARTLGAEHADFADAVAAGPDGTIYATGSIADDYFVAAWAPDGRLAWFRDDGKPPSGPRDWRVRSTGTAIAVSGNTVFVAGTRSDESGTQSFLKGYRR